MKNPTVADRRHKAPEADHRGAIFNDRLGPTDGQLADDLEEGVADLIGQMERAGIFRRDT